MNTYERPKPFRADFPWVPKTAALKPACLARDSERAVEMPAKLTVESHRILEPIERISEFLFGLIMAALKEDEPSVTGRS